MGEVGRVKVLIPNQKRMPYRFHYPQPRPEAVEKARQIIKENYGRDIDASEATEILSRLMRFLYLSAHPEDQSPTMEAEEEILVHSPSPKKSKKGKSVTRKTRINSD